MNRVFASFAVLCLAVSLQAQTIVTRENITEADIDKMAGSLYQYLPPTEPLTPAPKGFKPVYLTHYGRHGSRYLDNASNYDRPYNILKAADDADQLTDFGKDVLRRVTLIREGATRRAGDLTNKGKQQHIGIAHRMVVNYPELFTRDKTVVAKSTTSYRVLVSEYSALMEILRMRPYMNIDYDSSNFDEPYMYTEDRAAGSLKRNGGNAVSEFNKKHQHPERLMKALFKDPAYITNQDGRDQSGSLYTALYDMASNCQGEDCDVNMNDVFTLDEWYDMFLTNNMRWYSQGGNTPLTGNILHYGHCATLQNFIDCADAALAGNGVSLNLRYGHEVTLMSFFSLLDLNGSGYSNRDLNDLDDIANHWAAYNIAHMGGNVQWIFFRNKKGETIVKFLLNEEEATLPEAVPFYKDAKDREFRPFYRWEDVRKFYMDKITFWENYKAEHPEASASSSESRGRR